MSIWVKKENKLSDLLWWDLDLSKLDDQQIRLLEEKLELYLSKENTKQELSSFLWELDFWEGKKIDIASLPKYAWLWGKKKVVTDAGSLENMEINGAQMIAIVKVLDKYMEDSLDFCEWGLEDRINKLSDKQIEEVSSKYSELTKNKKLDKEQKARLMMVLVLEQLEDYDTAMYFIDGYLEWDDVKIWKSMKSKFQEYYKNLETSYGLLLDRAKKSKEKFRDDLKKREELRKKLEELKSYSNQLDENSEEIQKSVKYINNIVSFINGDSNYSKQEINQMVSYVDKLMKEIDFPQEIEENWKTIKIGLNRKLSRDNW